MAARHAFRKDAAVGGVELHAQPRRAERNQEHQCWHRNGQGAAHHTPGEARPATLLTWLLVGHLAHGQAVHSRSEHAQERGEEREAGEHGERHGDGAGDPNGAQDGEVEEHQADETEHHRHPTKEDGATGGCHGALHRQRHTISATRAATPELLAESRDHQQRIVDAETKAEQCGEVQHEDAHACHLRHAEDGGKCNEHCSTTNREWQSRCNRRAEDQQQHDRCKRQADQLAAAQVALRNTLNVGVEGGATSNLHG